jgi:small-conductance mechanosensitive channel
VGGTGLWIVLTTLLERLVLRRERRSRVYAVGKGRYAPAGTQPGTNLLHLMLQLVFFGGIGIIIWIACASAGFNPWTTAAASLGISVLFTYAFATPLGLLGSGMAVLLTNTIGVGEYWEFVGQPGLEGWIMSIYGLEVELLAPDGSLLSVPISTFLSAPRRRNLIKEAGEKPCRNKADCVLDVGVQRPMNKADWLAKMHNV